MSGRRCCPLRVVVWCSIVVALAGAGSARADVFNMPSGQTSMQFVNVGDPGNTGDTVKMNGQNLLIQEGYDTSSGYGPVSYSYAMSKYDVTSAQYCQFLNAVAKSDPYGLYNIGMATGGGAPAAGPVACGIIQSGSPGSYSYRVATTSDSPDGTHYFPACTANLPVNWDSWGDAARYANWLQNGQPTGPEGAGTTETGAYTLNGMFGAASTSNPVITTAYDMALFGVTRNAGAKYWIPTENEWYKAAYYKGGGTNSGYWFYPTQASSSNPPVSTLSISGTNNANYSSSGYTTPATGSPAVNWILTPVGYYAGSPSHYGTYDQGGDLYNFTETPVTQSNSNANMDEGQFVYVLRGGSFHHGAPDEEASNWRYGAEPAKPAHGRTFRLATAFVPLWNGGAANDNWSTVGNWSGDAAPSSGISVQFGGLAGGSAANNNDFTAGTQFNGIAFTAAAPSYNLQGNAVNLAGPVQNQSSNSQAIGLNITLVAGGGTFDPGTAGLTLSGSVGGAGSLTKIGAGTLTITGNNTYSGGTTVTSGTLQVAGSGSLPASGALAVGGGTFSFAGAGPQTVNGLTVNPGQSVVVNTSAGATPVLTLGSVARSVGGTLDFATAQNTSNEISTTFRNVNGIIGGWATQGGTATWAVGSPDGTTPTTVTGLAAGSYTPSVAATTAPGTAANVDFLSGNTAAWNTQSINSLRFNTAAATTLSLAASNALTLTSGGILVTGTVGNNLSTITGGTLEGASGADLVVIQNNAANGLTIASNIADNTTPTGLTKAGAGTLTLSGANTFTGGVNITAGTLLLGSNGALNNAAGSENAVAFTANSTGTLTLNGHGVVISNLSTSAAPGTPVVQNSSAAATLTVGNAANLSGVFAGQIQDGTGGALSLVKTGTGTLTLAGANTYTGGTTVSSGTLQVGSGGPAGTLGSGAVADAAQLLFNRSDTYVASQAISGVGGLTQIGAGTLILAAANTYSGGTTVSAGTLAVAGSLNATGGLTVGGGSFSFGGAAAQTVNGLTVNPGQSAVANTNPAATPVLTLGPITRNIGGTVDFDTATNASNTNEVTTTFANVNGIIGGWATQGNGATWAVAGSGTATAITGLAAGSYTASVAGTTTPGTAANVDFQASNTTGWGTQSINSLRFNTAAATTLNVTSGKILTDTSGGILVTGIVGSNLSTITGGTIKGASGKDLVVIQNNSSGGLMITSAIADNSTATGLTKSGAGTLTLTGTNSYTGVTSVNQGLLALGPGGSLANTALGVGNNGSGSATLQVYGNYAIGSGGGASLTVSGSTAGQCAVTFNPAETLTSTLTLSGAMTVGSAGNPPLLNFNLGNSSVDTIAASSLTVNAGGAVIGLNQLSGTSIGPGTYNLITFGSGSGLSGLTFAGGATAFSQNGDTFNLVSATGAEQLAVVIPPANAYWTGARGTSWSTLVGSSTNWGSTASGPDTNAIPGGNITNVFFTASSASNYASTTLDGNFGINSLTFNSNATGPCSIGPGSSAYTLTIYGASGITVNAGAGAATISAPLVLGAAQTWTNNSSSLLTISGNSVSNGGNTLTLAGSGNTTISAAINGSGGLTDSSSGTVRLSGANTFSGQTQASAAALLLANASALQNSTYVGGVANGLTFVPLIGTFTLGGLSGSSGLTLSDTGSAAVTLRVGNNGTSTTYSGALSGLGGLTKIGSGLLALTGANTYHAATTVSQGTLALGPGGSLTNTSVTVGNGASGNGLLQVNGSYTIGSGNLTLSGGGSTTGQGALTFNPAETGTSTLTLGGAMTVGSAGYPALLNFNLGNSSVDSIAASSLTVNAGGGIIGLNQLSGMSIVPGTYNLITFSGSGSGLSGLTFAGGATTLSQNGGNFKLLSTGGAEELAVLTPPPNAYWTGARGTSSWSTLAGGSNTNWGSTASGPDTNMFPGANSNIFFTASGAANYANTTLDGNFTVNSLTFNNSGAMGIAAGAPSTNTLTIGGAGGITVNAGAGPPTISAPLAIGASQTWTNSSSSLLTVSGSVSNGGNTLTLAGSGNTTISGAIGGGSGGVLAAGSGLVVLSGANTYTGGTTVSGGTLTLSGNGSINGTSAITVGSGTTLLVDNRGTANNARIADAAGITLNGGTFSLLGNNSAASSETVGALTIGPGVSTVTISRGTSSSYNAALVFGSNTASLASDLAWTAANIGSMVNFTATTPGQGGPGGAYTGGGITTAPGDYISFGGAANAGAPSINDPSAAIVVNGHSFARYSHSNGMHEETANSAGNISNFSYELGAAPANANVVINGTTATSCSSKTINDLMVQCATAQTSTLTGTLNIMNNGSGMGTPLDANGGILVSGAAPFAPSGGYTINGGTITSGNSGTNSTLYTWIDSNTTTINSVIADIGGGAITLLAKAGSGTLVLGGANTYSGGTALDQGVLNFASGALPHGASGINFYGGTLQWATGNTQDISAGIAPVAGGQTAILDTNNNNVSFATGLSGSGGLVKAGSGVLTLAAANTYSGGTTISGGTLQVGSGGTAGSLGSGPVANSAQLLF
ncbi:MAG: autotransporter-associated beta strand repeat-containing protein, partial [Thermoguttaceae bacterium]